jgi:hypothetical protein
MVPQQLTPDADSAAKCQGLLWAFSHDSQTSPRASPSTYEKNSAQLLGSITLSRPLG